MLDSEAAATSGTLKIFSFLPRRPNLSEEAFHDYWRHPHATWGKFVQPMRRYVQSHRIDCDLFDGSQHRFDGVPEGWVASAADVAAIMRDPAYLNYVNPDEVAPRHGTAELHGRA